MADVVGGLEVDPEPELDLLVVGAVEVVNAIAPKPLIIHFVQKLEEPDGLDVVRGLLLVPTEDDVELGRETSLPDPVCISGVVSVDTPVLSEEVAEVTKLAAGAGAIPLGKLSPLT